MKKVSKVESRMSARSTFLWAALALTGAEMARGEVMTFDVVPAQSQLTLSGTTSGSTLVQQAPGSMSTTFSGTILADVTDSQIRFVGGSLVKGADSGSYEPAVGGAAGTAPAAFGAKATVTVEIFTVEAKAAARSVAFDLESLALARTGGTFDARGVTFKVPETAGTKLDYRTTGNLQLKGAVDVLGLALNKAPGGTLAAVDGVDTLTVPVDASYFFQLVNPNDTEMRFTGQIVAKRRASVGPPEVGFVPPAAAGDPFTLIWSAGFKLQRATQLTPPNWTDVPAPSPYTVPTVQPGEFFRVVVAQ